MPENPRLLQCDLCGYHYSKAQMAIEHRTRVDEKGKLHPLPRRVYCLDSGRCKRNIARREADREALAK